MGARSRELASELDRAIGAVPSPSVRFASLALGGAGLAAAVSQSTSLTRPARTTAVSSRVLYAACVGFIALSVYTAMALLHRSLDLHAAVDTAEREASTTWVLSDVDTVPNPARVYRVMRSAMRLSEMSGFVPLAPLAALLPDARGPRDLGAALFEAYLLRPLAAALAEKIEADLVPVEDARAWLVRARRAGEWLAAWDGLADEPEQVDLSTLLADAFGDQASAWPDRPEQAIHAQPGNGARTRGRRTGPAVSLDAGARPVRRDDVALGARRLHQRPGCRRGAGGGGRTLGLASAAPCARRAAAVAVGPGAALGHRGEG